MWFWTFQLILMTFFFFFFLPCSDSSSTMRSISDPGLHSSSLSPQSMSSGGDSGVDSYCESMSDMPSIAISLCGGLTDNKEITNGTQSNDAIKWLPKYTLDTEWILTCVCFCLYRAVLWEDHLLSAIHRKPLHHWWPQLSCENRLKVRHYIYIDMFIYFVWIYWTCTVTHAQIVVFAKSAIAIKKRLLQRKVDWLHVFSSIFFVTDESYFVISLRYYNWSTAAPLVLAMQAFQKPLPKVKRDAHRNRYSWLSGL